MNKLTIDKGITDEQYINRLERAVHVLAATNRNWDMNVSVWDSELILSILDYMSMAKERIENKLT